MKKLLKLFNIGIFLFLGGVVNAETDLLGLANLAEGSTPSYAENTVVGMNESTGVKFLQNRGDPGKLSFPVNLSKEFEVSFRLGTSFANGGDGMDFSLIASDDSYITASFDYSWIEFGEYSKYRPDGWKDDNNSPINDVRLSVSNGIAKLYLNDVFFNKMTLSSPDLTYVKLNLSGFEGSDKVYALIITGQSDSPQPPVTGGDFNSGKQAGIQQCVSDPASCGISVSGGTCTGGAHATYSPATGEVHIPFIDVPGPFGGIQTYEVYLIQQPLTFAFDLDMNRINPR
jgi:hypothetical protein